MRIAWEEPHRDASALSPGACRLSRTRPPLRFSGHARGGNISWLLLHNGQGSDPPRRLPRRLQLGMDWLPDDAGLNHVPDSDRLLLREERASARRANARWSNPCDHADDKELLHDREDDQQFCGA